MNGESVAIVGGGPVGLALAIDLGQRGIPVDLFEKYESIHKIPKGQNLTQRSAESFQSWGVEDRIRESVAIPLSFGTAGLTAYRGLSSGYHYKWLVRSDVRAYYAAENLRIPQYTVENILRERAREIDCVSVHYNVEVTGVETPDTPVLTVKDRTSGEASRHNASYVVGCDGARSVVRDSVGITRTFRTNRKRMILAVFRCPEFDELMEQFDRISYLNVMNPDKEGYWQFFGRVEFGTWFFHTTVPEDSTAETLDFDEVLSTAVGQAVKAEVDYLGFWDLRIAVADNYRKGNVFIAGDAAHTHPPYGGYGVNNGFEDVRNLGWKLAAAIEGWGNDPLLDSYSTERKPVFDSTADAFIRRMIDEDAEFVSKFAPEINRQEFEAAWEQRSIGTKRDVDGYCPHYSGSPIVIGGAGASSAQGAHSHVARPGYLLSPKLDSAKQTSQIGLTLFVVGEADGVADAFIEASELTQIPLVVQTVPDNEQTQTWKSKAILVRPDRFVSWVWDGQAINARDVIRQAVAAG